MTTKRNDDYGREMKKAYEHKYGKVPISLDISKFMPKKVDKPFEIGDMKTSTPKVAQLVAIRRMKKL